MGKETQKARVEEIISAIEFEVRSLLQVDEHEPGRNTLASLAGYSEEDDVTGWFNGENFDELAKLAETDRRAYHLACTLAMQSVVNDGKGIPASVAMFVANELMKFDGGPPKKRGNKPTADEHLTNQIVRLARRVAKENDITFYPNEAKLHDFTACHIVAEALTRFYGDGREQKIPEKRRRFRASWIKEMSKSV